MTMAKSDEQRRVLRHLARSPNGCAETVLLENGFSYEQLLELVFDGFATIRPSVTYETPRTGHLDEDHRCRAEGQFAK